MRTKEEKRIAANIASKKYNAKNKETRLAYAKKYYEANQEELIAKAKKYHKSKILPYYIIYGLPNHFYCGVTNNPKFRMAKHRSAEKRTTHNYFIMATAETRDEALEIEAEFHDAGWNGRSAIHN